VTKEPIGRRPPLVPLGERPTGGGRGGSGVWREGRGRLWRTASVGRLPIRQRLMQGTGKINERRIGTRDLP